MSSVRRRAWNHVWIATASVVVLLAVIPQRHIPSCLTPFVVAKGRFAGEPIRLAAPQSGKPDVGATISIKMDQGTCRVSFRQGSHSTFVFSMGEGNMRRRIPAGSELVLDPQGAAGQYEASVGPEWHPLAPKARRFVFLPMAISMMVTPFFSARLRPQAKRLRGKRLLFLVGMAVFSGLVLYPAVHEGGHMLVGMLFGATPDWPGVRWTSLSGEEPHASFSYLPTNAAPFMSAAGAVVPMLVALLLLLIWALVHRHTSWYVSATLVSIPALFLLSTLGCLFELNQNTHMDALSVHFGLVGPLRVAFSLSPLLVAIAVYVWLWMKLRNQLRRADRPEGAA